MRIRFSILLSFVSLIVLSGCETRPLANKQPVVPSESLAESVAGTTWAGTTSDGENYEYHFLADGTLHWKSSRTGFSKNGTWKQDKNAIYLGMNNRFAELQGLITGTRMSGKARNIKGYRWTWQAGKETPITRNNSQITFPHYSIVVPPDQWHLIRPNENAEVAVVTTKINLDLGEPATYRMQFARNEVLHEIPRSWSAREVADDFRSMERQNMIAQGTWRGQYFRDVVLSEESVGDKKFYTMKYSASDSNVNLSASLYLYFPREEKNAHFMVIHYSEAIPRGAANVVSFREDFLETLKSLRINE